VEYRNPTPTVDVVVETDGGIVLIERANEPFGWALPGGFVDEGETVEHAAVREVEEETGLQVRLRALLYVYSDPKRDPRKHTMSTVFVGRADGVPRGSDDAKTARVFALDALPDPLCFDHGRILADYQRWLSTGKRPLE
jgi:8-oxo-dGTP diphosphatase